MIGMDGKYGTGLGPLVVHCALISLVGQSSMERID
jgi:hypothetical protein